MRTSFLIGGFFVFAASVALNITFYIENQRKDFLISIENKRSEINNDMIAELTYASKEKENNAQIAKMEGYNEAINSLVNKIDPKESQISNIWHLGYYRGLEQTDYVGEMRFEQGYAQGFQKGTNENMKAIQTILKSGDNIKNAIENFVQNQSKATENTEKSQEPVKPSK